jgi:hypothetical protein
MWLADSRGFQYILTRVVELISLIQQECIHSLIVVENSTFFNERIMMAIHENSNTSRRRVVESSDWIEEYTFSTTIPR